MGKNLKYLLICLIAAIVVYLLLPNRPGKRPMYTIEGLAQGSYYRISYFNDLIGRKAEKIRPEYLQVKIDSILKDFDLCASLWEDSSLICKVNRGEDPELSSMFIDIFEKSMEVSRLTDGAFDITVAPLVKAYGFAKGNNTAKTSSKAHIDSLLNLVGYTKIRIENKHIVRDVSGVQLDFNAIAQGYCTDIIASYLDSLGVSRYLVDIGGEMLVKGKKNKGEFWKIGIEKPADSANGDRSIYTSLELTDQAIVTSGNYRKYFELDGKRYAHTINPFTGKPAMHTLLSASVICSEAWKADALATAFMVMGLEKTQEFLKNYPQSQYKVFLIYTLENVEYAYWKTDNLSL